MNSNLTLQRTCERAAARELSNILYALTNNAYGSSAELITALSSVIEYLELNFEGGGIEDEAAQLFEEWEKWSTKQQEKWLEAHSFRNLCEEWEPKVLAVRQLTKLRQREGYLPWQDESLIDRVMQFNGCSEPIAKLQLYYEFSHQGLNKHDRILKTLPYMIRLLSRDLIEHYLKLRQ